MCACESLEPRQLLTTYYVATTGSNTTGGTHGSSTAPWQTIGYATTHITAGDTVLIHTGVYREKVTLPYFSSTAVTTINTDGSGPVTIEGADQYTGSWALYTAVAPTAGGTVYSTSYPGTSPQEVINSGTWLQEIGTESTVYDDSAGGEGSNSQRIPFGSNSVTAMVPNSFYFVPGAGASGGTLYIDLPTGTSPGGDMEISARDGWMQAVYSGTNEPRDYVIENLNFIYSNTAQDSTSSSAFPPACIKMPLNSSLINCNMQYADFTAVAMESGCTVQGCTINYSGCYALGAGGSCSGLTISNNTIDYNNFRHFDPEWGAGGIKLIATGSSGFEVGNVFGNTFQGNFGTAFWSDTNTLNTASTPLLFYDNIVADNCPIAADYFPGESTFGEAGIKIEVSTYVRVYNNLIVNNYPNGIIIVASQHTDVYNNTIVGNHGLAGLAAGFTPRTISSTGVNKPLQFDDFENNIIYDNYSTYDLLIQQDSPSGQTLTAGNNTSDHNLIYRFGGPLQLSNGNPGGFPGTNGTNYSYWNALRPVMTNLSTWTATTGHDANSISSDPHLLNAGSRNYQLGSNSPAIGKGATLDLNGDGSSTNDTDFTGTAIRTVPFDIGAYKFVSGGGAGPSETLPTLNSQAWVDDSLPAGAIAVSSKPSTGNGSWNWLSLTTPSKSPFADVPSPAAQSGFFSVIPDELTSNGVNAMSFEGATATMAVGPNDTLSAYVYIDPADRPDEIMIQWEVGTTWHRAYWGSDKITSFTTIMPDDTGTTRTLMGGVPSQAGWVRLDIAASAVGLNTGTVSNPLQVTGLSLDTYNGQAAWDDIGVNFPAPPVTAQWMNPAGGDWNTSGNWSGGIPTVVTSEADFYGAISSAQTVNTNTAITLTTLRFNNAKTYTLTGTSLKLQATTGSALIDVEAGDQIIQMPLTLASDTTFNVVPGATLDIAGAFTVNAGVTLSITGGGNVLYDSSINVLAGGKMTIGNSIFASSLTLGLSSQFIVATSSTATPTILQLNVLNFGGSTDNWQGLLDLNNNDLILHGGAAANLLNQIKEGSNFARGGYWNGTAGITSSKAAGDSRFLHALGWLLNNDGHNNRLYGTNGLLGTTFDGQSPGLNDLLVKYTTFGDADLNGTLNGADYQQIDLGFQTAGATGWINGNFNYDSAVNGTDFSLIDNAYNQQVAMGNLNPNSVVVTASAVKATSFTTRAVVASVSSTFTAATFPAPALSLFNDLPIAGSTDDLLKRIFRRSSRDVSV